jgi:hypothetical protein
MNKKDLLKSLSVLLPIFFIILIYSAWDLIKINNIDEYGKIIFYLFSLFYFYSMGIKYSKKNLEISRFFFLITSIQFVLGFGFIDQIFKLSPDNYNENYRLFLKLICFLVILRMTLITKSFELQCGSAIIYFQIIISFLGRDDLFGISLTLINLILISSRGFFAKIISIIAETLLIMIVMIATYRAQQGFQVIILIDKISAMLMIINYILLIIMLLKSQDKLEKKSLLCLAILMPIFFIPHKMIMFVGFCMFSYALTVLMIIRKRMHATIILLIYSILMVLIIVFSSVGRGGSKLTGDEFVAFKYLIIVAFCVQLYEFYKHKMLKKNRNLRVENTNSSAENSEKSD